MSRKADKREQAMRRKFQSNQRAQQDYNTIMASVPTYNVNIVPFLLGAMFRRNTK